MFYIPETQKAVKALTPGGISATQPWGWLESFCWEHFAPGIVSAYRELRSKQQQALVCL